MRHRILPVFQHLALVAMLALACVPTLGRMAQRNVATQAAPATHEAPAHAGHHGDHAGHAMVSEAPPDARIRADDETTPPPHHGTSGDCDYCPLLQGLLTPGVGPIASTRAPAPAEPRLRATDARFDTPHPTGLGSRGPPLS